MLTAEEIAEIVADAVKLGAETISDRLGQEVPMPDPMTTIGYTTWAEIAEAVRSAADAYDNHDQSAVQAIRRVAASVAEAVIAHS